MEERYSALVVHLQKCRERRRKRVEQMAALLCAESVNGPAFGHEGNMIASMLEDAPDADDRELSGKQESGSAGDATNQQAAAGVLKHIRRHLMHGSNGILWLPCADAPSIALQGRDGRGTQALC